MSISQIITIINIVMAVVVISALLKTMKNYRVTLHTSIFIFLTFASMVAFCLAQVYLLTEQIQTDWRVRIFSWFWVAKSLYYAWYIRFSALKKDNKK
jgi:L-cystine uptake protein TcyP (sodium:dicarboxylate symporter family)